MKFHFLTVPFFQINDKIFYYLEKLSFHIWFINDDNNNRMCICILSACIFDFDFFLIAINVI